MGNKGSADRESKEIERARIEGEQAGQAKADFLVGTVHDLRTPLNSIIAMSRLLVEDDNIDEDVRDTVGIIYRSGQNLLHIVNDLLDQSKVDAGEMKLQEDTFAIEDLIEDLMEEMLVSMSLKGLFLRKLEERHIDPERPVLGDYICLRRILTNLLSNAVKYTDEGGVTISYKLVPAENDSVRFKCEIIDTGIGIPEDELKDVFANFEQSDSSETRRQGGTGVGLHITQKLVELMSGELSVTSSLEEGSVFSIDVPFVLDDGKNRDQSNRDSHDVHPDRVESPVPIRQAKILVVDDYKFNRIYLKKLLGKWSVGLVDFSKTGLEAVEALKTQTYDIVFMDCHMPEMNGYDATREIRRREREDNAVVILAMTADVGDGVKERSIAAGMDGYISKPIDSDALKFEMSRWFNFDAPESDDIATAENAGKSSSPVDFGLIEGFVDNDDELKKFVMTFLNQADATLEILSEHRVDGESKEWAEAAHKLKGGAGMFGADKLAVLCDNAQAMKTATAAQRESVYCKIEESYGLVKSALTDRWTCHEKVDSTFKN